MLGFAKLDTGQLALRLILGAYMVVGRAVAAVVRAPFKAARARRARRERALAEAERASLIVSEVAEFAYDRELRRCVVEPLFRRGPLEAAGSWIASPGWVSEVPLFGWASEREVELWLGELRCAA